MQEQQLAALSGLILRTTTRRDLEVLLQGLLTPQELDEVVLRWRLMAALLAGGKQRDISRQLGISLGKIARGSRLLKYGPPEFRQLAEALLRGETAQGGVAGDR
jgi:TrpR family trp operon transcriptional repressor